MRAREREKRGRERVRERPVGLATIPVTLPYPKSNRANVKESVDEECVCVNEERET